MNGLDNEGLLAEVKRVFELWIGEGQKQKFTPTYFLDNCDSFTKEKFSSRVRKKEGFWADILIQSNINPNCFTTKIVKGNENKERLVQAILEVRDLLGISNLNDDSMNNSKYFIDMPKALVSFYGDFSLSDRYELQPKISLAAFQRRCFKEFGSWDDALKSAGIDISDVKRKIASHGILDLLEWFDRFVDEKQNLWTVTVIRDEDHALFKAIGNNSLRNTPSQIIPTAELSDEYIYNFWVFWRFWKEHNSLDFSYPWHADRESELKTYYESNHRAQERWSLEKIQKQALSIYSSNGNLNRDELNSTAEGRRLLAAMRSSRFSQSGGESETLARVGVRVDNLRNLNNILQDISLENVFLEMRRILSESLTTGVNLLSRESMEKHNSDVFHAAMRWQNRLSNSTIAQNDWSKTLSFFGLNPATFELSAHKRGRRGAAFQRFFENLIRQRFTEVFAPEDVLASSQVCFNKSFSTSNCQHEIRCKPDFVFSNCIIDTKVGGSLAKVEQLERYLDHSSNVFIVTINDKPKSVTLKNGVVEILGFAQFLLESERLIGVRFEGNLEDELTEILRVSSAFSVES